MSMGITQMNSLLSSANALKSVNNLSTSRTQINGQSRILSAEIKTDKDRGVDTKKKEEELAETEERLQNIDGDISNRLNELNERLEADREKIHEEEAEQANQAKKATEIKNIMVSDNVANTNTSVSGITASADTLEISREAKAAAAADATVYVAHTPVASMPAQSTGQVLDKKV